MAGRWSVLVVAGLALAGCLGGLDDPEAGQEPPGATTLDHVMGMERWTPGDVEVQGRAEEVRVIETPHGPQFHVRLTSHPPVREGTSAPADMQEFLAFQLRKELVVVRGDPADPPAVGSRVRATLHFEEVTFNGARGVTAPELPVPFPFLAQEIVTFVDLTSHAAGGQLVLQGTDADGWSTFEVRSAFGDKSPVDKLGVTLHRWTPLAGPLDSPEAWVEAMAGVFVGASNLVGDGRPTELPVVDGLQPLAQGVSPGGTLRFEDVDGDGQAGDGDLLHVLLRMEAGAWHMHALHFSGWAWSPAGPLKLLLAGPDGVAEGAQAEGLRFEAVEDGPTMVLRVAAPYGPPRPLEDYRVHVHFDGEPRLEVALQPGPVGSDGATLRFLDSGDGLLGAGDVFLVGGAEGHSDATLWLRDPEGDALARVHWHPGHGRIPGQVSFWFAHGDPSRVAVLEVEQPHPELALGKTLRVEVRQDGVTLLDAPLAAGVVGAWDGGAIGFVDGDADGALTTGDRLELAGGTGRYQVELSALSGAVRATATLQA